MDGHGFGVELEHTLISSLHTCAWYMAWLDAVRVGDTAVQEAILTVMTEVIPFSPIYHLTVQEASLSIAHQAAPGDPSLVQRHVDLNCGMAFPSPTVIPAAHGVHHQWA